jgi:hypothetical protein
MIVRVLGGHFNRYLIANFLYAKVSRITAVGILTIVGDRRSYWVARLNFLINLNPMRQVSIPLHWDPSEPHQPQPIDAMTILAPLQRHLPV